MVAIHDACFEADRADSFTIQFDRSDVVLVFPKETIQCAFWDIEKLRNILFDGDVIGRRTDKACILN